jgi:predicted anti-sigma-YlaC factor YlaD
MINCAVIKDLLPLYADDVLSNESKELVSKHLATCESCRTELADMKSEIKKPQTNSDTKINLLKLNMSVPLGTAGRLR